MTNEQETKAQVVDKPEFEEVMKVVKKGAFFYITERGQSKEGFASEPYDDTVYSYGDYRAKLAIASKGFRNNKAALVERQTWYHDRVRRFMSEMKKVDTPVNEVVSYFDLKERISHTDQYQDGVRKVGHLWWKREEPVMKLNTWHEAVDVNTNEILIDGSTVPAGVLIYFAARQEDTVNSDGYQDIAVITQGVVAAATDIEKIVAPLILEPSLASKVFERAFPKMEAEYHAQPNGRIIVAKLDEVGARINHSESLERLAVSYER